MKKAVFACLLALLVLAGALAAVALLGGCSSPLPKVGLLIYDQNDTFMMEMKDKILQQVKGSFTPILLYAQKNQQLQNQQILQLMDEGVDLLIINAVDRLACSTISEKTSKAGLPTIFINREPLANDIKGKPNVFYIGAAAESLGEKQAVLAAELFGESFAGSVYDKNSDGVIQMVVLKGEQGHQDAEKRTEKCVEVLSGLGYRLDVLEIKVANWQREQAKAAMDELYAKFGGEVELIFANNDDMALGAIDFLSSKGLMRYHSGEYAQDYVIIGVDGTQQGVAAVKGGLMYGTILNDATAQSDAAVTLVDYILHEKPLSDYPYQITNGQFVYINGKPILVRD